MQLTRAVRGAVSDSPLLTQASESGWRRYQQSIRSRKIARYLAEHDRVRLMIGAGPSARDGWLSTDLLPSRSDVVLLDAAEPFPFADGVVDRIHSEHMIEHVDHAVGRHMLAECFRILKPGGRVRIATPDIDRVLALAGPVDPDLATMARQSNVRRGVDAAEAADPIYAINRLFSGFGHRFLYSEAMLGRVMAQAGFESVERYGVGDTLDLEFVGLEQHSQRIDPDWNEYQTMVIEADKPRLPA